MVIRAICAPSPSEALAPVWTGVFHRGFSFVHSALEGFYAGYEPRLCFQLPWVLLEPKSAWGAVHAEVLLMN
jgi:hypothetical protein